MSVTLFLLQIAGFALQTVPVALLMCVPFGDTELRYSRRKTTLLLLIAVAAASLGFALAEAAVQMRENGANIFMAAFILIEFGIYFALAKAKTMSKLLVMIILIHYAAVLFTVSNILIRTRVFAEKLAISETGLSYGPRSVAAFLIVTLLTFPMVYPFMRRVVRPAISLGDNKAMKRGFVYFMAELVLFCVATVFFDFYYGRDIYENKGSIVFFAAFILTDFIMYYMFFFEIKLVQENSILAGKVRSFDEQYDRISRSIEDSRRIRRDIRHHLNAISEMNRLGKSGELTEYLEAYTGNYGEPDSALLCGYHAIDNTLSHYIGVAREKGITVKTEFSSVRPDMDFDVTDMTVLMGNLMENAVEGCEALPENAEKLIRIKIMQAEVSILIKIENSCRTDLDTQTDFTDSGSFVSTKHSKHGGQGLKSVCLVAEKYGGSAEFKRGNGIFTARAVLNIP